MSELEETQAELQRCRSELDETRAQLQQLQERERRNSQRRRWLGRWGLGLLAGSELRARSREWFAKLAEVRRPSDLASSESADLVSAIVGRFVRIGVFGLVVAAFAILTPIVTLWQSFLIRDQNTTMQRQVDQQAGDNLIVRRAQLLATVYEGDDCLSSQLAEGESEEAIAQKQPDPAADETEKWAITRARLRSRICAPTSHIRARQEAILAFVEIERSREAKPDLRYSHFKKGNLVGANLSSVNLMGAQFEGTKLDRTDLERANLGLGNFTTATFAEANLRRAFLRGADFRHAFLLGADLRGADLHHADFTHAFFKSADLSEADLTGAILHHASELTQGQIDSAKGSETTVLPDELERPGHWFSPARSIAEDSVLKKLFSDEDLTG